MPHVDPIERAAYGKAYRERNRGLIKERSRAWRVKNAARIKVMKHDEYLQHREAYLARSRQRWAARKDEANARRRTPEFRARKNAQSKQRWALLPSWERRYYSGLAQVYDRHHAQLGNTAGLKDWYRVTFATSTVACEYCEKIIDAANVRVDHKQPYRFGGRHEASNLAAVCEDCNKLKGATPWEVWSAFLDKKRGAKWQ